MLSLYAFGPINVDAIKVAERYETVLNALLAREQMTLADISRVTGLSIGEVRDQIFRLKQAGVVREIPYSGIPYYTLLIPIIKSDVAEDLVALVGRYRQMLSIRMRTGILQTLRDVAEKLYAKRLRDEDLEFIVLSYSLGFIFLRKFKEAGLISSDNWAVFGAPKEVINFDELPIWKARAQSDSYAFYSHGYRHQRLSFPKVFDHTSIFSEEIPGILRAVGDILNEIYAMGGEADARRYLTLPRDIRLVSEITGYVRIEMGVKAGVPFFSPADYKAVLGFSDYLYNMLTNEINSFFKDAENLFVGYGLSSYGLRKGDFLSLAWHVFYGTILKDLIQSGEVSVSQKPDGGLYARWVALETPT